MKWPTRLINVTSARKVNGVNISTVTSPHATVAMRLSFHIVLSNESIYVRLFQLVKTFDCHCVYSVIAGWLSIHLDRCNGWPSGKWIAPLSGRTEWGAVQVFSALNCFPFKCPRYQGMQCFRADCSYFIICFQSLKTLILSLSLSPSIHIILIHIYGTSVLLKNNCFA